MKIVVTKKALKELLNSSIPNRAPEPIVVPEPEVPLQPVNPNPHMVDKDGVIDYPVHDPSFVPLNMDQLKGSINKLLVNVPGDHIVKAYRQIDSIIKNIEQADSLEDFANKADDRDMQSPAMKNGTEGPMKRTGVSRPATVESTELDRLRKLVAEALVVEADEKEDDENDDGRDAMGFSPEDSPSYMQLHKGDMEMASDERLEARHHLNYIAKRTGFKSGSGARLAIEKALLKLRYLITLPTKHRETMILEAMNDYINHLASSGELNSEEVQMLRAHPAIIVSLAGFRHFLRKYIMRGMRQAGIKHWNTQDFDAKMNATDDRGDF